MILNAEQEEYLPFITDSAGLIVNIHSPDSKPWSHEHGVFISPGFNTEIAVEIVSIMRISPKKSNPSSAPNICRKKFM